MYWFIRFSSDKTEKSQIVELLELKKYIVSKEYSKRSKLHYHILCDLEFNIKQEVQDFIYDRLGHLAHHKNKGGGIKGTQTLDVKPMGNTDEDLRQTGMYTVKDQDFIFDGFSKEYIEYVTTHSFQKEESPTVQIAEAINFHTEQSLLPHSHFDAKQLYIDICLIYAKFNKEIFPHRITAKVLSAYIARFPEYAEELAEKEIEKLSLP